MIAPSLDFPRPIELLAPAKTADIGIEAIRHGADAVYIGASQFGARSAAGNSLEDIARLCDFAHLYGARVYVTVNTILYDDELKAAENMIHALYRSGVDALIVQDLGVLRLELPPIALHASTQMDITSVERARFLEAAGFTQLVLARELSLNEIQTIHQSTSVPLEGFVHGALCVSYSGRCYVSQHCFGRSANRGTCAQFCRLKFDLLDADGQTLVAGKHLLSLRDMNRTAHIGEMLEAGISSFKIEGRLKEMGYVKNITAHYRQVIDRHLAAHPERYCRSSYGHTHLQFTPQPDKSFNRGFTDYFLHGRTKVAHPESPKSMGEKVGKVIRSQQCDLQVQTTASLSAGDGLCYLTPQGELKGFRINNMIKPEVARLSQPLYIAPGTSLYRNFDLQFEKLLARPTAERVLEATFTLQTTDDGFRLHLRDETGLEVEQTFEADRQIAQKPQADRQREILSKTGDTPFHIEQVILPEQDYFIPSSLLTSWRRTLTERLLNLRYTRYERPRPGVPQCPLSPEKLDFTANVANREAAAFYHEHGAKEVAPAYELAAPSAATLMTCRHCILFDQDHCLKRSPHAQTWKFPLSLRMDDGRIFPLQFDCKKCEMRVLSPKS